ncbi:MAG TPA: hypothetical protein VGO52_25780 [Hyphomonadaceae bacterium]|jgi:hypothetical protein|nr:hypothetical protein [Hyphomonadaceae bacterium]
MKVCIATLVGGLAVASCSTPFSTAVSDYDMGKPQAPAVVVLSDPQVYARETLVNDRRDEIAYLKDVLERSQTVTFAPQLRRDLQTLTGFVGQLDLLKDPAAGLQFQRDRDEADQDDERRDLEHRTAMVNAEAALVRANAALLEEQRKLEALQNKETPAE